MRLRSHKAVNYNVDHLQPTRAERELARRRVELKPKKKPSKSTKSSIKITVDHQQPTRTQRQRACWFVKPTPKQEPSKSTKSSIKITKILPKSSHFELRDCRVVLKRIDLSKYQLTCKMPHGLRVNLTQLAKTAAKKKPDADARIRSTRYSPKSTPWH